MADSRTTGIAALNGLVILIAAVHTALGLWGTNVCGLGSLPGGASAAPPALSTCVVFVVLPALLLAASAAGIVAARRGSERLFAAYVLGMAAVMLLQTLAAGRALATTSGMAAAAYDLWDAAYRARPDVILRLEKSLACCGFASPHDRAVPEDCASSAALGFGVPCRPALVSALSAAARVLGWYGLGLVLLEGVVVVASAVLFHRLQLARAEFDAARVDAEPRVYRSSNY